MARLCPATRRDSMGRIGARAHRPYVYYLIVRDFSALYLKLLPLFEGKNFTPENRFASIANRQSDLPFATRPKKTGSFHVTLARPLPNRLARAAVTLARCTRVDRRRRQAAFVGGVHSLHATAAPAGNRVGAVSERTRKRGRCGPSRELELHSLMIWGMLQK
ncbi:hypothetical protein EVAR_4731_1 [Eumeta japonica]|uniref:Uncharacterized protein n=1 Tax=Eumeta variegata TaxID=151549 RepID=A0A4C1T1K3_EUMVA|nr:hypothetical protein EVAR_4731_1 [Eumeta japonica]